MAEMSPKTSTANFVLPMFWRSKRETQRKANIGHISVTKPPTGLFHLADRCPMPLRKQNLLMLFFHGSSWRLTPKYIRVEKDGH